LASGGVLEGFFGRDGRARFIGPQHRVHVQDVLHRRDVLCIELLYLSKILKNTPKLLLQERDLFFSKLELEPA
jgi:hypothetical protein